MLLYYFIFSLFSESHLTRPYITCIDLEGIIFEWCLLSIKETRGLLPWSGQIMLILMELNPRPSD